jgi:proline iminopeptidase
MEKYISDINSIANHYNLISFHLLGHSWGGLYAQIFAAKHPDKVLSLFLISPAPGTGKQWKEGMSEVTAYHKSKSSLTALIEMVIASTLGMFGMDEGYQKLFAMMTVNFNKGFKTSGLSTFEISCVKAKPIMPTAKAILKYPLLEPMSNVKYKISVLLGDTDIIGQSRKYIYERLPAGTFHIIPQCGHLPWIHNPSDFYNRLNQHFNISKSNTNTSP